MFCTITDMTNTFGVKEIEMLAQSLGDKTQPLSHATNQQIVQSAIDDACEEMEMELCGHFDIVELRAKIAAGKIISGLKHLCKDISRYHLYTCIRLSTENGGKDHESYRRYMDAIEHLRLLIKNKCLIDSDGNTIKSKSGIRVECKDACIPDTCCCSNCGIGGCDCQ